METVIMGCRVIPDKSNDIPMALIKRGGGTGPMKPGNQPYGQVPIPSGVAMPSWKIRDEISISSGGGDFCLMQPLAYTISKRGAPMG